MNCAKFEDSKGIDLRFRMHGYTYSFKWKLIWRIKCPAFNYLISLKLEAFSKLFFWSYLF